MAGAFVPLASVNQTAQNQYGTTSSCLPNSSTQRVCRTLLTICGRWFLVSDTALSLTGAAPSGCLGDSLLRMDLLMTFDFLIPGTTPGCRCVKSSLQAQKLFILFTLNNLCLRVAIWACYYASTYFQVLRNTGFELKSKAPTISNWALFVPISV